MAVKQVEIPHIGTIKLYKRRSARSIRLSVTSTGDVRVSLPYWLPYDAGARFAAAQQNWILAQLQRQTAPLLTHGQAIGKSHHLQFVATPDGTRISTRVDGTNIRITHPFALRTNHPSVQKAAEKACIRALRTQAETLLPQRLRTLAANHTLPFKSVNVRRLTGRWGSCNTSQEIVLNLYLMQLPWHLIDYVLLHELTHTRVMNHGSDFWDEFELHLPNAKILRREIRAFRPVVTGGDRLALSRT